MNSYIILAGRFLLTMIFILSGLGKIPGWAETAGYMAAKGMPMVPFFLVTAILLEIGGGLSVLLGLKPRLGALALAVFLIPATLIFHNFWAYEGPERQTQMIMFLKNLSILGALILVSSQGLRLPEPGPEEEELQASEEDLN